MARVLDAYFSFRSHIFLHMSTCKKKALECQVPGCKAIRMRHDVQKHNDHAAASHYRLQCGEIQRLGRLINSRVNTYIVPLL